LLTDCSGCPFVIAGLFGTPRGRKSGLKAGFEELVFGDERFESLSREGPVLPVLPFRAFMAYKMDTLR